MTVSPSSRLWAPRPPSLYATSVPSSRRLSSFSPALLVDWFVILPEEAEEEAGLTCGRTAQNNRLAQAGPAHLLSRRNESRLVLLFKEDEGQQCH